MVSRCRWVTAGTALLLLLAHDSSSQTSSCRPLAAPVMRGLEATLRGTTEELAKLFNMSFTVGLATCDDHDFAFAAGLDDRFERTP